LWHLRYPMAGNPKEFLIVATTRPETMLGDVAVAVHPDDERYTKWSGKKGLLPIVDREIPVSADSLAGKEDGSGAGTITPAHDFNDFEVGQRNQLPRINIFDAQASLVGGLPGLASGWAHKDRFEVRDLVIQEFQRHGLLDKVEDHQNRVGTSERWGDIVE